MVSFQYEALRINDRSKQNGVISASSEKEAREMLREQNLIPTRIAIINTESRAGQKKQGFITSLIQRITGVGTKDRITFTRNIGMMLRAGIPVTEALLYFENFTTNPRFRQVIA